MTHFGTPFGPGSGPRYPGIHPNPPSDHLRVINLGPRNGPFWTFLGPIDRSIDRSITGLGPLNGPLLDHFWTIPGSPYYMVELP